MQTDPTEEIGYRDVRPEPHCDGTYIIKRERGKRKERGEQERERKKEKEISLPSKI